MKIMVGMFTNEANEHIPNLADIPDFDIAFGNDTIRKSKKFLKMKGLK